MASRKKKPKKAKGKRSGQSTRDQTFYLRLTPAQQKKVKAAFGYEVKVLNMSVEHFPFSKKRSSAMKVLQIENVASVESISGGGETIN